MPNAQTVKPSEGTTSPPSIATSSSTRVTSNVVEKASLTEKPVGEERWKCIAEGAYRRAEQRGFAPGGEVDDWLAAEREFDAAGGSSID